MKKCGICTHEQRPAIDTALVENGSLRDVAGRFTVSRSALDRHRKHIPKALTKARQAEEIAESTSLLSRVEKLMSRCETIFDRAMAAGKWSGAAAAARELRGCLELLGKLSGELQANGARVAINMETTKIDAKIDIKTLSDQQLEDLLARLCDTDENEKLELAQKLDIAPVFNVQFVRPGEEVPALPAPEKSEVWKRNDEQHARIRREWGYQD
jgi:hypothetical protein